MTIVEMCIHMDCAGCEAKIKKALQKLPGVDDVDINISMQKVTVMGWADQKTVLKTVRKTGRRAELWPYPHNPEYHGFNRQYYSRSDQISKESKIVTHFAYPKPSSSYNYYKHGYSNSEDFGYYQKPVGSTIINEKAMSMFSDDNPHACTIL